MQILYHALSAPFLLQAQAEKTYWLPPQSAEHAKEVDAVFYGIYWLSVFFFVLIAGLTILFVVKYRRKGETDAPISERAHNTPLEIGWTILPTLIVAVIFFIGFHSYMRAAIPPENSYQVSVTGIKWNWMFTYPNGYIDNNLHVPVDTPVKLTITSEDVIHSVFIPNFRLKMDAVPGRYNVAWFNADEAGEYDLFCTEYCGTKHSEMLAKVVVHPPGEFETWLADASDFVKNLPPAEAGEKLYKVRGCAQCHSINGTAGIGPTFQGVYGKTEKMTDGSDITVEDNYIRESILNPQAKIVAGYQPVMPTYKGRIKDE
ncbi:MAG: cytochrome c oxidase subunit II, partial [Candidatus Omnitrophica bacterium]|nr:cytochrome c oxidase subunit II [Candidatus Omnitrophota bacterium]